MTDEDFFSTIRHFKQMIREQNRKIDELQKKYNYIILSNYKDECAAWVEQKTKELEGLKNGKEIKE